jgi:hypothetical protein
VFYLEGNHIMEKKKPYTPPTITDHGKVETETQGLINYAYETFGRRAALGDPENPDAN